MALNKQIWVSQLKENFYPETLVSNKNGLVKKLIK